MNWNKPNVWILVVFPLVVAAAIWWNAFAVVTAGQYTERYRHQGFTEERTVTYREHPDKFVLRIVIEMGSATACTAIGVGLAVLIWRRRRVEQ